MEGTDEIKISKVDQNKFMTAVRELCGVRFSEEAITAIRNRLWYIYSQSAQYKEDA
eukprot:CAMPEP_0202472586 /NCGR_PEP_ID=MMETSP1360-20130828/88262_1 /ASSEMBLY_ACC=CAM_ASM_000848 /TAXON_ID=515479 /ORGANISM="Licmophora paradoxa, Strain CCMP2313" /LENGTH=55 /DNA_ID=CAMNT_0049099135 /DNA_START=471 /DNA_END=635 /DNA_ORIENTATION=-